MGPASIGGRFFRTAFVRRSQRFGAINLLLIHLMQIPIERGRDGSHRDWLLPLATAITASVCASRLIVRVETMLKNDRSFLEVRAGVQLAAFDQVHRFFVSLVVACPQAFVPLRALLIRHLAIASVAVSLVLLEHPLEDF